MKHVLVLMVTILLQMPSAGLIQAQSNTFVGSWKFNPAKSAFDPGPGPQSQMRTWAADGRVTVEGMSAAGQAVVYGYTIVTDGEHYPTTGKVPNSADSVYSVQIDARTIEANFSRGGEHSDVTRFEVSEDGLELTVTAQGRLPDGRLLNDLLVYDKQR